jgi:nicotinamide-nucleotide amidase
MHPPQDRSQDLSDRATAVVCAAAARKLTLVTAESCTAGSLATLLAEVPGAGDVFHGGFVTYSKANKTAALGVPAEMIEKQTAVSAEVAGAMARGALERSPAEIAVAITGVAGPEPDEDGNPVGLVYLAAANRSGLLLAEEHRFEEASKEQICNRALACALALLERAVKEEKETGPKQPAS